jgi:hypothetical protein
MTWLDHVCLSGADFAFGAIVMNNVQATLLNDADVSRLTAIGSDGRFNALRPAPARLESESGSRRPAHTNNIHPRLVGRPRLIRRVEITHLNSGHAFSFPTLWG